MQTKLGIDMKPKFTWLGAILRVVRGWAGARAAKATQHAEGHSVYAVHAVRIDLDARIQGHAGPLKVQLPLLLLTRLHQV